MEKAIGATGAPRSNNSPGGMSWGYALLGLAVGVMMLLGRWYWQLEPAAGLSHRHERLIGVDPSASCGPVSVAVVSALLDRPLSIADSNARCQVTPAGVTSMADLQQALEQLGFGVRAVRLTVHSPVVVSTPVIVYFPADHFAVALPVNDQRVILIDPPAKVTTETWPELWQRSDGAALVVARTPQELAPELAQR